MRNLLFVDDDPDIRTVAEVALSVAGDFQVTCAASGAEALERAADSRPDLVLLDMMMPEMDGLETLAALRSVPELRSLPVIFLTASVQKHDVERYRQAGARGVLAKPFDPMTLSEDIRRVLDDT